MRRVTVSSVPWNRLFGELAVIVAGVLIALAMDSWWDRRQEQKQAEGYLQQLLVDFQGTERALEAAITADTKMLERVNSVLNLAFRRPFPPDDSLELPTGYNQFEPLTGTLTALVQGGDLRLISNDSIRFDLIRLSTVLEATKTILRDAETLIWHSTEQVVLGRARHSRYMPAGEASSGGGSVKVDAATALNDPDIIGALQLQAVASQIRLFNLRRLQKPTARLIGRLEAELGNRDR